jgi:hypothetical protein
MSSSMFCVVGCNVLETFGRCQEELQNKKDLMTNAEEFTIDLSVRVYKGYDSLPREGM